ncbi:MAG: AraC family transcriptional regulator of adaptative response [Sulfurimonas sp.]|jgi:AraC family transcriptional regulator of adaptative response/methylated-DNA-[protein]-cysteine methyltransferase
MQNSFKIDSNNYKKIEEVINYIDENFKEKPSLDTIAKHVGLSKYHFSRLFKEYAGVTPIQFLHATTLEYAKTHLKESRSILETSLELGLTSSSRLHDMFVNFVGVTPKEYKELGKNIEIVYGYGNTPFSKALLASTKRGICFLAFDEDEEKLLYELQKSWSNALLIRDDEKINGQLKSIFLDKKKVDIFVKGTNFQINVWKALLNIPDASLSTYQDIANYIDKPKAVRAVATAIGSNDIAYLIPCHRVIGKSGAMSGYRWTIQRKKIILAYEAMKERDEKDK